MMRTFQFLCGAVADVPGDLRHPAPGEPGLLLVADALVLLGASGEDAAGVAVALEPRRAALELTARLYRTDTASLTGVLRQRLHLRPEGLGPQLGGALNG